MKDTDISANWSLTYNGAYMKLKASKGFTDLSMPKGCACCGTVAGEATVDQTSDTGFNISGYIRKADADLMAAAPDLLAALIEAEDALVDAEFSPRGHVLTLVRLAITKARGWV